MTENIDKNKRRTLRGVLGTILSLPVTVPLSLPTIPPAILGTLFLFKPFIDMNEYERKRIEKSRNFGVNLRNSENGFINIGVTHIDSQIETQLKETILLDSIEEADIILLESFSELDAHLGFEGYFYKLKKIAENKGKRVVDIDATNTILGLTLSTAATFYSSFRGLKQLFFDLIKIGEETEEKKRLRNEKFIYMLKTLGIAEFGIFPPDFFIAAFSEFQDGDYSGKYQVNHTVDARTVFMVVKVLKKIKENPGKKILVITGDVHATGIDYYLKKEGKEYLNLKNAIYSILYGIFRLMPF